MVLIVSVKVNVNVIVVNAGWFLGADERNRIRTEELTKRTKRLVTYMSGRASC